MKYFLTLIFLSLSAGQLSAQYIRVDSARLIIWSAKTPAQKFKGYRSLDRYYYTTGLYDSSAMVQQKMYAIAKQLNNDSMMVLVNRAIGNRFVTRSDYNFGLNAYIKGLEYAKTDDSKGIFYGNLAYVYAVAGNNEVALKYIKKWDAIGVSPDGTFFKNILYGLVYNNLNQPDSALVYLQKAAIVAPGNLDPTLVSIMLTQTAKTYELRRDNDLADVYYKKAVAYCKQKKLASGQVRHGSVYCDFCIKNGNYALAKTIAVENLAVAKKAKITEGISTVAEILRKIYAHELKQDSAYFYAVMQINYKDSVSSQKRIAEFQNLTFAQQLREIDEQAKMELAKEQRRQNIEYVAIALALVAFIMLFLLLSRSVIVNTRIIEIVGVIGLLIVFEFINLVLHPYLVNLTKDSPVLMLLILVLIAAVIVPLHHQLEQWVKNKLVEKNKAVRLAAAKRTIEQLEGGG